MKRAVGRDGIPLRLLAVGVLLLVLLGSAMAVGRGERGAIRQGLSLRGTGEFPAFVMDLEISDEQATIMATFICI